MGVGTFSISYFAEFIILQGMGLHPELSFYISNFTMSDQNITGVSLSALVICLIGNIFNVWAEEGLFRGLLFGIGRTRYSDRAANLIQAVLFGLWHIIVVIVWLAQGSIGIAAALVMAAGYVLLAGVLGYEWGLCYLLTGTLWTGVFEHFFNNFLSNSLHVITENGADELQIVRIVLSNVLSLLIVIILSVTRKNRKNFIHA